ncbi:MAG: glucose-1-phosphate thymidylyltransferase [bacterium]
MIGAQEFFDLKDFTHRELFSATEGVWTALNTLPDYLETFFKESWPLSGICGHIHKPLVIHNRKVREDCHVRATGPKGAMQAYCKGELINAASIIMPGAYLFDDRIIIGSGTVVEPGALIKGPAVFGDNTEIRQSAYVRGDCLVGDGCVVGHATEIKGSIMLDGAKAGHFAYIGDSILGVKVNLGAGTKLANLRVIEGTISIKSGKERYNTHRRKLGAILGDQTETGCNAVTSPGTLVGQRSIIYPCAVVPPGYYPGRNHFISSPSSLRIINK